MKEGSGPGELWPDRLQPPYRAFTSSFSCDSGFGAWSDRHRSQLINLDRTVSMVVLCCYLKAYDLSELPR